MSTKVTILGSGTSTGVPKIGCDCEVCRSADVRDRRLRASALVEVDGIRILIDCSPDFREQMLGMPFAPIDGVLVTHEHYDHVGGIDDLRPFCKWGDVPLYVEDYVGERLMKRIPYCFGEHKYPGVPQITLQTVVPGHIFTIRGVEVTPIRVIHGKLPILGYRIGRMVYITDMKSLPEESMAYLRDVDCLIVNALRHEPHWSHQSLAEALAFADKVQARETYFIHMNHRIGRHAAVEATLPDRVHLAYDGLVIHC